MLESLGHHKASKSTLLLLLLLLQCAAVAADFTVARQEEVQRLLQDLEQRRVAHQAAHELWLAGRYAHYCVKQCTGVQCISW